MASSRLSSSEDDLTSPLEEDQEEEEEDQEEEEEEEVVVKSKVKRESVGTVEEDTQSTHLESHIDTPLNGDLASTMTLRSITLEVADTDSSIEQDGTASTEYRLWNTNGEFGLSGQFRIQGKKKTLILEDDTIQWYQKGKEIEKEVLSLADIMTVVPLPNRGQSSHEAIRFKIHGLQSQPGTCGKLLEVVCQPDDPHPAATTQTWVDHLNQQIQNFGNRPRRLYVIINPLSGDNSGQSVWNKVEPLFRLANINTEAFVTQRRFHAREVMQSLDLAQYDGVVVVGGDGTINEVINGLMVQAQQTAGINLRRTRFIPVQPNIRVGFIPAGFSNSIAWSILGTKCPFTAAAQILLGCISPMDVCSISNNGQLLLFSGGPISYGLMSEVCVFSRDFTWLGNRRIDIAQLRALLYSRDFEAEVSYIPVADHSTILSMKNKCYSGCNKCTDYDSPLEAQSVMNEKGASVMATYSNVERTQSIMLDKSLGTIWSKYYPLTKLTTVRNQNYNFTVHVRRSTCGWAFPHVGGRFPDPPLHKPAPNNLSDQLNGVPDEDWKKVSGIFSTIISCPLSCRSQQAQNGLSPWAHQGDGCTDLIFVRQSSKLDIVKWLLRQRKSENAFELPFVEIKRVKEFKFREILTLPKRRPEEEENLVDNDAEDEDDVTNRRGSLRHQQSRDQTITPTSHWNVDGDDLNRVDINVRVHRHMLQVFARGIEPSLSNPINDNNVQDSPPNVLGRETTPTPDPSLETETSDKSGQFLIPSS